MHARKAQKFHASTYTHHCDYTKAPFLSFEIVFLSLFVDETIPFGSGRMPSLLFTSTYTMLHAATHSKTNSVSFAGCSYLTVVSNAKS